MSHENSEKHMTEMSSAPPPIYAMPQPGVTAMPQPTPILNQPGNMPPTYGQPISVQPGMVPGNWMPLPEAPPNCPPGLEYLSLIDQILVHQKVEVLEAITGFETKNKYHIRNSLGQDVFYAKEDSDFLSRNCLGAIRPFEMEIKDNFKREVIHLSRPLGCGSCCFPCCLQSIEVSAPPGNVIGSVEQKWSIFFPEFVVKNANGDTMYRISGPFWTCSCCCSDVEFTITTADGKEEIGKITKQWSGFVKEAYTDADNFGITFPMSMDVKMKAVMLGACILIDFMYFEQTGNNRRHHNRY